MGPNQGRKARVIAKIKGFTDLEPETVKEASRRWISVHRPNGEDSETVTVSFGGDESTSRKETYEFDCFYDRSEENDLIFPREVKPLIEDVFNGYNATVIAYGARTCGKTYTIQGTEEKPGLAILAMGEFLSKAEEGGKSISISYYEISKDHAYDLLDPNRHEVFVWEDVAHGKIQLKGLSQVPVKSIEEFQKLYLSTKSSCILTTKQSQKIIVEPHHRSHKVLIVNVFQLYPPFEGSDALPLGKMNFVDLAGYEDGRKSTGGVNLLENNKINKSIYAVHNVVYALNSNESHVPYRESKLTRMLRDSLGGRNKILMITCLNSSVCQDSLYMANLASRSCKGTSRIILDSTKKSKSMVRPLVVSSSSKSRLLGSLSATATKQTGTGVGTPGNKANVKASAVKARKLFDEARHSTKSKKASQEESLPLEIVSTNTELVRPMVVSSSSKSRLLGSLSATATKQTGTGVGNPGNKANVKASAIKARKLFDEARHSTKSKKASQEESLPLEIVSTNTELVRPMVVSSSIKSRLLGSLSATATKQTGTRVGTPGNKANVRTSAIKARYGSLSATATKQTGTRVGTPGNKANVRASAIKARKLFDEARHSTKSNKASQEESLPLEIVSTITELATQEEEKDSSGISEAQVCLAEEHILLQDLSAEESDMLVKPSTQETKVLDKVNMTDENDQDKATPNIDSNAKALSFVEADQTINKENNLLFVNKDDSPPISTRLQELSNNLKMLYCSTPSCIDILPKSDGSFNEQVPTEILEPKTPEPRLLLNDKSDMADASCSSWKAFSARSSRMKDSLVDDYLRFLNTASKDELKRLKGIGEKRATYILELREESPVPFKDLDDLKDIGLSEKQIKGIVSKEIGGLFN